MSQDNIDGKYKSRIILFWCNYVYIPHTIIFDSFFNFIFWATEAAFTLSKFSWSKSVNENLVNVFVDKVHVYTIKVLWATCKRNRLKMHKKSNKYVDIFRKNFILFLRVLCFAMILIYLIMRNFIRKYKFEYIFFILQVLIYYFVSEIFFIEINFFLNFTCSNM